MPGGSSLTIKARGEYGNGILIAKADEGGAAGIGGVDKSSVGNITIEGGTVIATGGSRFIGSGSAGIGGGRGDGAICRPFQRRRAATGSSARSLRLIYNKIIVQE